MLKGFPADTPRADRRRAAHAAGVHQAVRRPAQRRDRAHRARGHRRHASLTPGHVYLAPGDFHLEVKTQGAGVVDQARTRRRRRTSAAPPSTRCSAPSRSSTAPRSLACVLTGMGSDGSRGAGVLRAARGHVVAQDEATSVVWGMPGATTNAGNADAVLPLPDIAPYLVSALRGGRGLASAAARAAGSPDRASGPPMSLTPRDLRVRAHARPQGGGDRAGAGQGVPRRGAAAAAGQGRRAGRRRRVRRRRCAAPWTVSRSSGWSTPSPPTRRRGCATASRSRRWSPTSCPRSWPRPSSAAHAASTSGRRRARQRPGAVRHRDDGRRTAAHLRLARRDPRHRHQPGDARAGAGGRLQPARGQPRPAGDDAGQALHAAPARSGRSATTSAGR